MLATTSDGKDPDMTEAESRLSDELDEQGLLRRIEYVRGKMHGWGLTAGDPGHIDVEDADNLDPEHPPLCQSRPSRPRQLLRPDRR